LIKGHIEGYIPYSRFNRKALDRIVMRIAAAQRRLERTQPGTRSYQERERILLGLTERLAVMQEIHDRYWADREASKYKRQPYNTTKE
jgi:hypothetical protein